MHYLLGFNTRLYHIRMQAVDSLLIDICDKLGTISTNINVSNAIRDTKSYLL